MKISIVIILQIANGQKNHYLIIMIRTRIIIIAISSKLHILGLNPATLTLH